MATHYSILAWKIKWTKQAGGPQFTHGGHQELEVT